MGQIFHDDTIDTRKIIERMDDLELEHSDDDGEVINVGLWDEADRREYRGLAEVVEEIGDVACRDGVTLIHERYFTAHIKDLYQETGGEYHEVDHKTHTYRHVQLSELYSRMPFKHIDWESVAQDEWSDYSQLEVDGVTYLYLEP